MMTAPLSRSDDGQSRTLCYIADPMCSWCWGFAGVLERVGAALPAGVQLRYVMGGLAPDSSLPMPDDVRAYVQHAWRDVAARTGAAFNWAFWDQCQPRRSTYPACRAVIAAEQLQQGAAPDMFQRVQRAYYQEARNPADTDTLVALAAEAGFGQDTFRAALAASETEALLQDDFACRRRMGCRQFPSLIFDDATGPTTITLGYSDWPEVAGRLNAALA
jgi:putative protein-disulfide isomerase